MFLFIFVEGEDSQSSKPLQSECSDSKVEGKTDSPDSSVKTEVYTPSNSEEKQILSNDEEIESTCETSKLNTSNSSSAPQENGEVVRKGISVCILNHSKTISFLLFTKKMFFENNKLLCDS